MSTPNVFVRILPLLNEVTHHHNIVNCDLYLDYSYVHVRPWRRCHTGESVAMDDGCQRSRSQVV